MSDTEEPFNLDDIPLPEFSSSDEEITALTAVRPDRAKQAIYRQTAKHKATVQKNREAAMAKARAKKEENDKLRKEGKLPPLKRAGSKNPPDPVTGLRQGEVLLVELDPSKAPDQLPEKKARKMKLAEIKKQDAQIFDGHLLQLSRSLMKDFDRLYKKNNPRTQWEMSRWVYERTFGKAQENVNITGNVQTSFADLLVDVANEFRKKRSNEELLNDLEVIDMTPDKDNDDNN